MARSYSLEAVRMRYGVPVKRGMRVTTETGEHGTVTCGDGMHVRVRLDGEKHSGRWHPFSLDYGDGITIDARQAHDNVRVDAWNDWLNGRITDDEYRERMAVRLPQPDLMAALEESLSTALAPRDSQLPEEGR